MSRHLFAVARLAAGAWDCSDPVPPIVVDQGSITIRTRPPATGAMCGSW